MTSSDQDASNPDATAPVASDPTTSKTDDDDDARRRIRAACGAFLYVSFADASFDPSEEARLLAGLANRAPFSDFASALLEDEYNALIATLRTDFSTAAAAILDDVRWAANQPAMANAVVAAARAAIVADARLEAQEEAALARLADALGRPAGDL